MQVFRATCFTFSSSYLGTSCFVCVCLLGGILSCFLYPGFLHGIASGQLGLLLSLDHRRLDDRH